MGASFTVSSDSYRGELPQETCPVVVNTKTQLRLWLHETMHENVSSTFVTVRDAADEDGESLLPTISSATVESYSMDFDDYDWRIFTEPHYYEFYGVALPALGAIGIVLNIFSLMVFHHKDMRSLCTLFLKATLTFDIVYILCIVMIRTPMSRLSHVYKSPDQAGFWPALYLNQSIYTWLYPLTEMADCFVVFYLTAAVWDQYCVFYHPEFLSRFSRKDKGMKVLVTILMINVLIHMVHFFKFVRKNILNPGGRHKHWRICLSDIYRSENYQAYDKYVYFVLFQMLPTVVVFVFIIPMVKAYHSHKKEIVRSQLPDINLIRTFKSGRSVPMMFTIGFTFIVLKTTSNVAYIWTMRFIRFDLFSPECELSPTDRRFDCVAPQIELIYVAANAAHSSIKFFLFLCSSPEFRSIFWRNVIYHVTGIKDGLRKLRHECLVFCNLHNQTEIPARGDAMRMGNRANIVTISR